MEDICQQVEVCYGLRSKSSSVLACHCCCQSRKQYLIQFKFKENFVLNVLHIVDDVYFGLGNRYSSLILSLLLHCFSFPLLKFEIFGRKKYLLWLCLLASLNEISVLLILCIFIGDSKGSFNSMTTSKLGYWTGRVVITWCITLRVVVSMKGKFTWLL